MGCGEQPWRNLVETLGARSHLGADVEQNTSGSVMLRCLADALPLADGTVDVVLCTEVLEHLPDPGRALAELRRVSGPAAWRWLTAPFEIRCTSSPVSSTG